MKKIRVLLAADHPITREGLKKMIDTQPDIEVVGEAEDGKAAQQKANEIQPDVVLMDISMPETTSVQVTQRLKRDHPSIKVLAFTAHENNDYLRQLFKAGASGYLLKRAAAADLVHALRTVASGGMYIDPALANKIVKGYFQTQTATDNSQQRELSEREAEIVRRIAWGYGNKEIAFQLDISVKTVETYKARLMEKLGFRTRLEIVRYALRQGWLQVE